MGVECRNCQQQLQLLQPVLRICIVSLVSMGKGAMQHEDHHLVSQAGVLASLATAGLRNKTDIQWNVPGGGQASYKDDWRNWREKEIKEGSKCVTWDELVHVRTIEPSHRHGHGHELGQYHQPRHRHGHQPRHWPGYQARDNSFHNSVTSQVFDL